MDAPSAPSSVDLFWLPLGAGDSSGLVRHTGRLYESIVARLHRRTPRALYHSALQVHLSGDRHVIEMTPQWGLPAANRGEVVEGPVGMRMLGRSSLFRYEVHRWRDGVIPDEAAADGGPVRVSTDEETARRLLELVPEFPDHTWGRDGQATGDMWNSNSLTSWLVTRSGHRVDAIAPPRCGLAPGWSAGLVVATRQVALLQEAGTAAPRRDGPLSTSA